MTEHPTESHSSAEPASREGRGARLAAQTERLHLLVLHLAGRAILARTEPEDLVQEVFLRALAADDFPAASEEDPGDAALWGLVSTIARHVVIDVARALRTRKRDGRTDPLVRSEWSRVAGVRESQLGGAAPGPATVAIGAERQRDLERGFLALDPDHRRVIGLRQFEGLSAAAAARRMGRTETAVHSLYRRALEAWETASR